MQLVINVVLFALGFSCAAVAGARPQKSRANFERILQNVNYILDSIRGFLWQNKNSKNNHVSADSKILLTRGEIEEHYETDTWQRKAYDDFKETMVSPTSTFPCVYATAGFNDNEHRYVFLDSEDPTEARNVRKVSKALQEYLSIASSLGDNTTLVVMAVPPRAEVATIEEYRSQFWNLLKGLRIADPQHWPSDMPTETGSNEWTFCFDNVPLFPVALTPAHDKRCSRKAANFLVAIQPKWVLDKLLATQEKREHATGKVRHLLEEYDQIEISPDLTQYGQPGTTEAKQYFLLDSNESSECPFADIND